MFHICLELDLYKETFCYPFMLTLYVFAAHILGMVKNLTCVHRNDEKSLIQNRLFIACMQYVGYVSLIQKDPFQNSLRGMSLLLIVHDDL